MRKPIFAINAEKNINFLIDYQCPQCGAPAVIQETDRLFKCEYCKVSSYLVPPDVFRYVLPVHKSLKKNTLNTDLLYVPYWRFKGMLFSCVPNDIKNRFMDISHISLNADFLPMSLGLRSQAMKLTFITSDINGQFFQPTLSSKTAMETFTAKFDKELPKPIFFQEYIGDTLSLIYSPVYMTDKLYDAVVNQPITIANTDETDIENLPAKRLDWKLDFLATLCPDCGWNLEGEKDAMTLMCRNCDTLWMPLKKGFKKLPYATQPDKAADRVYLPFWKIQADVSGINLSTVGDLVRAANLPKVVQEEWEKEPFQFWIMAFKVRPNVFLRTATAITMAQPNPTLEKRLPKHQTVFPVNLPISEALESLKLIVANFVRPRENFFPRLEEIDIKPQRFSLVYLPFKQNQHEYLNPEYHLSVTKTHLMNAFK